MLWSRVAHLCAPCYSTVIGQRPSLSSWAFLHERWSPDFILESQETVTDLCVCSVAHWELANKIINQRKLSVAFLIQQNERTAFTWLGVFHPKLACDWEEDGHFIDTNIRHHLLENSNDKRMGMECIIEPEHVINWFWSQISRYDVCWSYIITTSS